MPCLKGYKQIDGKPSCQCCSWELMIVRRCFALLALVALVALVACARERVEVAETEAPDSGGPTNASDADPPPFNTLDGSLDALPSCGPPPSIGRCAQQCPTGYKPLDDGGGPSCECCPPWLLRTARPS
jgi:hypothetical protein